ncbi:carbonic anhydrase [Massarina eburnea CBS 473.64]|uniref:Carbonic anhydrase n=1 Tax=Massarina eburnea CBS 473.64 TaxID=1395130 RepID=A0A6A6SJP5_9PLEO|nr:carbonic anhydrase [Massarina eburnea CBS 473.64]
MAEARFQQLLQRNKNNLPPYITPPPIQFLETPQKKENGAIFIISCSDPRIEPADFLGLIKGEAGVIRVAGGRVEGQVLRGLEIMGSIAPIGLVVVMHHSDCGGLYRTDEDVGMILAERNPGHVHVVEGKVFGTFGKLGLEGSIVDDVEKIKAWPFLPKFAAVKGYAFITETGELKEVI